VTLRATDQLAHDLAASEGVCVRPLLRRLIDRDTGGESTVILACGSTRAAKCPPCADKPADCGCSNAPKAGT
jgi:hypothetical protein